MKLATQNEIMATEGLAHRLHHLTRLLEILVAALIATFLGFLIGVLVANLVADFSNPTVPWPIKIQN